MAESRQLIQRLLGGVAASVVEVLAATNTVAAKPSSLSDGVSVKGVGGVDLLLDFSVAGSGCEFRVWLRFGTVWHAAESTKIVTGVAGVTKIYTDSYSTGAANAIFIELVTAPAAGTVAVSMTPSGETLNGEGV